MPPTLVKPGLKMESGGPARLSQEIKVGNLPNGKVHSTSKVFILALYPSTPTIGLHDTSDESILTV
jgi:hypothetical protein